MSKKQAKPPNLREAVILSILVNGEKYGLQLRDEFKKRTGQDLPLGSLYPTMDKLIDKGFVKGRTGNSEHVRGGNARRYYRITADGHQALRFAETCIHAVQGGLT